MVGGRGRGFRGASMIKQSVLISDFTVQASRYPQADPAAGFYHCVSAGTPEKEIGPDYTEKYLDIAFVVPRVTMIWKKSELPVIVQACCIDRPQVFLAFKVIIWDQILKEDLGKITQFLCVFFCGYFCEGMIY